MKEKLIIAAISARGYAQAAHEHTYRVVTLDAFADADTQAFAEQCFKIKFDEKGVDEADFKHQFSQIEIDSNCYFIYGSLFDTNSALLEWVAEQVKVIGNSAETLQLVRGFDFFRLLDDLNIVHPEVRLNAPDDVENWLAKSLFSTGGMHVKPASMYKINDYFQRKIEGVAVSLLFVADGKVAKAIGFNQQFSAPIAELPYRFAGAVSNVDLPRQVQQQFIEVAEKLTAALGLKGINSLDAVLDGDQLWILELNPRLSATFHLYPNLLQVHMQASAGDFEELANEFHLAKKSTSKAELIVYAEQALNIPVDFSWPKWVADIPNFENKSINIAKNEPICTVFAEAQDALVAQQLVLQKTKILKRELLHDSK
ncbi:MAG: ATP-grasp domain-containing protein [Methylotenera sp.]|uniref:ATP-grasp domain-containing protein n=1 Tax=Methylotenera sp. TaxID=2051956 RepID=UPI002486FB69|nr:ATP-grasp domain-containing protein [Methylotenera sp.]MDI1309596.1 ATP-grasp domain-containing protein [Methylotenera sp.]